MAKQATNNPNNKLNAVDQTFSFKAPGAANVMLVGDFTHWQQSPVSLRKQPDGIWRVTIPLSPGEHHYRFLVDGEWRDDPECKLQIPNPFGSRDSVIRVSAE
jgi:1,4-alpha-glucan branching enzyme